MFLAVVALPQVPDALERAAAATGQVRADVQRRLAGLLPRVILVDVDPGVVAKVQARLDAAGFRTLAFEPTKAPGDGKRTVARTLDVAALDLGAITLIQRGTRVTSTLETVKTKERQFSMGSAILSSGLKMRKTVTKDVTTGAETRDPFLLLSRRDGGAGVVLYESRLDYRFLGAKLGPVAHANFEQTVAEVRRLTPQARFDDRVGKPGFVTGLPACAADPLDVALHLVELTDRLLFP